MAQIIGRTPNGEMLVKMTPSDAQRISGNSGIKPGDEFEITPLYNSLKEILDQQNRITDLSNQLEDAGKALKGHLGKLKRSKR